MGYSVLCIEDDRKIAALVSHALSGLCDRVDNAVDGLSAWQAINQTRYDLLILDLMLPDLDGRQICQRLRESSNQVPVVMLTARSSEDDCIAGLESGADDYITKPFNIRELQLRVKAILRRQGASGDAETVTGMLATEFRAGNLKIDTITRKVFKHEQRVDLTSREYDLLLHFIRHPGQVFSRNQLLDAVWGCTYTGYEHTVSSHINRLRSKIEEDPARPEYIETVWGMGYKLTDAV